MPWRQRRSGIECSLKARDMTWEWLSDANEKFATGDVVNVQVKKVTGDSVESMKVEVSAREAKVNVKIQIVIWKREKGRLSQGFSSLDELYGFIR